MTLKEVIHEIHDGEIMWGYSLKERMNILLWDKPYYVSQTIDVLRCLYDVMHCSLLENTSNKCKESEEMTIQAFILALEKNKCSEGDLLSVWLNHKMPEEKWSYGELDILTAEIGEYVTKVCINIGKAAFDCAYRENEYVRDYMDKYYAGVTYIL